MRHLKSEFDTGPDQQQIMARIGAQAQAVFNANLQPQSHQSSRIALGVCSLMLAAYRELLVELDSAGKAYDKVERCFAATYQAFIRNVCKPLFLSSTPAAAPLERMNFKTWSAHLYATASQFPAAAAAPGAPGYQRFFREHDAPALAQMMHAIDQAWIEAAANYVQIRRNAQSGASPRPSIDGLGFLPFQFAPTDGTRSSVRPAVVQKLQTPRAAQAQGAVERRWNTHGVEAQVAVPRSSIVCDGVACRLAA